MLLLKDCDIVQSKQQVLDHPVNNKFKNLTLNYLQSFLLEWYSILIYLVTYESDMFSGLPVEYIKASSTRTQGNILFGSCHTSVLKK